MLMPDTRRRPPVGGRRACGGRLDQSSPPRPRPRPWPPLSSPASTPEPWSSLTSWLGPSSEPPRPLEPLPLLLELLLLEPRPLLSSATLLPPPSSDPRLRSRSSFASWLRPSSAPRPRSSLTSWFGPSAPRPRSSLTSWFVPSSAPRLRCRCWCVVVAVVVLGVVVVVCVVAAEEVPAGSSAPCEPIAVMATVPPARRAPVSAAMTMNRRMSVVAPVVTAAAASRALDERGDPRAVRAPHVGLDAGEPGAQAGEAADALEAGGARDLDGHRAALGVAQAERAGAAVDGQDGALELAGRGLRGRGGGRLGGRRRGRRDRRGGAEGGDGCGGDGDLPDSHDPSLGARVRCEIRMRLGRETAGQRRSRTRPGKG